MSNISNLSLNLLVEQVYLEGQIHMMYEQILKEEDKPSDPESESLVKKVIADLKLNADFMFTFGVGIAAFIGPVNELLSNQGIRITKYDVTLLVITALYIILTKSKSDIDILMAKVKEHKLDSELKKVIKFVNSTVGVFRVIGKKVGVTITTLIDVLGFTFMSVPVLNLIKNIAAEKGYSVDNIEQLFTGLMLSAGTYLLKNVLKKRIKESEEDFDWLENLSTNLTHYEDENAKGYYNAEDKRIGPWEFYYYNGNLQSKGEYLNGVENGPWEFYYSNGNLANKGKYLNGKQTGPWEFYYYNGNLEFKGEFLNGKQTGPWELYSPNGELNKIVNY